VREEVQEEGGITCGEGKDGVGRVPARARRARRESKKGGSIDGSLAQVGFTSGAALAFQVHALLVWVGPDVRVGHILCSTGPTRLPCCSGGPHFVLNWTTICHWHADQEKIRERRTVYARDRRTHAVRRQEDAQLLLSYMLCAVA
jgi:hypothetical protein